MKIKLSEIRKIIVEEMTDHQKMKAKSIIQSVLRCADAYVSQMKTGTGALGAGTHKQNLLNVVDKELVHFGKWLTSKGSTHGAIVQNVVDLSHELIKSGSSASSFLKKKEDKIKNLDEILLKIKKIIFDTWKIEIYDVDYQKFDDDSKRVDYAAPEKV